MAMNKEVILLVDYRNQFYFSTRHRGASVQLDRLAAFFADAGYTLTIRRFSELDLRNENFAGRWILYQSSEDPGIRYKDYIEDILLALELQGARLIPDFKYFRAHHNKVFMELLRDLLPIPEVKSIVSRAFGTNEEYAQSALAQTSESLVLKPSAGTRSSGVRLLDTDRKRNRGPYRISRTYTLDNTKLLISKLMTGKPFTPMSNNRQKFIIQNFIPGLKGDYRIIVYGDKYYSVFRGNRKDDFRASGSGKLDFVQRPPDELLEYAYRVYSQFDTPFMSLDIGSQDGQFYLFEFQCLCLGQYTFEKSRGFYTKSTDGKWKFVEEHPDLEREIANTVLAHIQKREKAAVCVPS